MSSFLKTLKHKHLILGCSLDPGADCLKHKTQQNENAKETICKML